MNFIAPIAISPSLSGIPSHQQDMRFSGMDIRRASIPSGQTFPPVQHWDIVVNGLGNANLRNLTGASC